ncbi:hypothetical protein SPRG_19606 [Saprolegnia parasitica CBS 223.65]|uniref:Fibronectin type-III domain-containing protein n=1 Tax=Saprolegnia parasitica (strain CBS 223.65) TaxID=695850 RepID=A0A067CPB9_SAPPC|nr:hypothetical protein SPRG_19606 [Saprolegnia parasitica CBS 223.65]KDO31085.1 hypothetical protein SPRG_19606 [Saprolegnia parasitica CBS 223.65]|eukprot:XP_012198338.1 hypothetical protein SPRG_19606 [Saprolegnia parasitica CBS 223.65]
MSTAAATSIDDYIADVVYCYPHATIAKPSTGPSCGLESSLAACAPSPTTLTATWTVDAVGTPLRSALRAVLVVCTHSTPCALATSSTGTVAYLPFKNLPSAPPFSVAQSVTGLAPNATYAVYVLSSDASSNYVVYQSYQMPAALESEAIAQTTTAPPLASTPPPLTSPPLTSPPPPLTSPLAPHTSMADSSFSTAAIVGVVVACLLLVAGVAWWVLHGSRRRRLPLPAPLETPTVFDLDQGKYTQVVYNEG